MLASLQLLSKTERRILIAFTASFVCTLIAAIVAGVLRANPATQKSSIPAMVLIVFTIGMIASSAALIWHEEKLRKQERSGRTQTFSMDVGTQEWPHPIKITLEIDGGPVTIEVPDVGRAEEVLAAAQRLRSVFPSPARFEEMSLHSPTESVLEGKEG